jgi:hypothetical protein
MATTETRSEQSGQFVFNANIASNTTTAGTIIDTADFDGGLTFQMFISAFTNGSYLPLIEESDDSGMSGAVAISDDKLIGTEVGATLAALTADTEVVKSIGVFSNLRFIRLSFVSSGSSGAGADVHALIIKKAEISPAEGLSA